MNTNISDDRRIIVESILTGVNVFMSVKDEENKLMNLKTQLKIISSRYIYYNIFINPDNTTTLTIEVESKFLPLKERPLITSVLQKTHLELNIYHKTMS